MPDQRIGSPSVSRNPFSLNREMHAKSHEIRAAETRVSIVEPRLATFLGADLPSAWPIAMIDHDLRETRKRG